MHWTKRIGDRIIASALVGVLLLSSQAAIAQEEPVLRLATQFLPPYQMLEDGQMTGVAVVRVRCALDKIGLPYELHMMEWSEAQIATENGEMDGFFVGSSNASRERYAVASDPVITESLAWYMRRGLEVDPNDPADKLSARYSAKFATSKWLHLKSDDYNVVMKPRDAESLLKMLVSGDIDVALEYELIFEHYMTLRGIPLDEFRKIPDALNSMSVHFSKTFDNAHPAFRREFNVHLAECVRKNP